MLASEDLVDLAAALRASSAGFRISTQQVIAAQQLLVRLAAEGALPPARAGLATWLGPVLCTSAAEQAAFGGLYEAWLAQRFGEGRAAQETPAALAIDQQLHRQPAWARATAAVVAGVVLAAAAGWLVNQIRSTEPRPVDPVVQPADQAASAAAVAQPAASLPQAAVEAPQLLATIDLKDAIPEPTFFERLDLRNLAIALLPLLLYGLWLMRMLLRRPALQRLSSRTPDQMRQVHVPGAARRLLPGLPLRRLAQELRRRRVVVSRELQVEPTLHATLARGGLFTPVSGSRAEPAYLALVDRCGLSDHQALLAAEVVAELARGDVLIERYDFRRDAGIVLPAQADARQPGYRAQAAQPAQAMDLAELRERCAEHRVLVFGDAAGCFDGFTGQPAAWVETLAAWPMPVLLTPVPAARWGRAEWALQRLGIQVLPLDAAGVSVLMGLASGAGASAAAIEPPRGHQPSSYERAERRMLGRDAPQEEAARGVLADLRRDLGPRAFAWLAACAAYPEVHWGITLRLGAALVPQPAEFGRLLPELTRLVWLREAYLPDWLRERLLGELAPSDEKTVRDTLNQMLEAVVRDDAAIPLRIALGRPQDAQQPAWRRVLRRLGDWRRLARVRELLRDAPGDSPLRDHVFLRFLSGAGMRRIDLRAPGGLLAALRAVPSAWPVWLGGGVLAVCVGLAVGLPVWHGAPPIWTFDGAQFLADSAELQVRVGIPGIVGVTDSRVADIRVREVAGTWKMTRQTSNGYPYSVSEVSPNGHLLRIDGTGSIWKLTAQGADSSRFVDLEGAAGVTEWSAFSADGNHYAMLDEEGLRVWNINDGRLERKIRGRYKLAALSPDGRSTAVVDEAGRVELQSSDGSTTVVVGPNSRTSTLSLTSPPEGIALSTGASRLAIWTAKGPMIMKLRDDWAVTFLRGADYGIESLVFSPDGDRVYGVSSAFGNLLKWDTSGDRLDSGKAQPTLPGRVLRISPDGRRLAMVSKDAITIWSPDGGQAIQAPAIQRVIAPAVQPAFDPGDVAWMITATAAAWLACAALVLFAAGFSRTAGRPTAAWSMACSFALVQLLWFLYAYSLAFTPGNAIVGGLSRAFFSGLIQVDTGALSTVNYYGKGVHLPEILFAAFNGALAGLAACLLVMGLADRLRPRALGAFVALWLTFVYAPLAHMVWYWRGADAYASKSVADAANALAGLAWQWGVLDSGGGLVVVLAAAASGLAATAVLPLLRPAPQVAGVPAPVGSALLELAGAGLLWVGWCGANAGGLLEAGPGGAMALAATMLGPAASVLGWMLADALHLTLRGWAGQAPERPASSQTAWGILAGLAATAPAAGNVGLMGAVALGLVAGFVCCQIARVSFALRWGSGRILFGVLFAAAALGVLLTGVFNAPGMGGTGFVVDWVAGTLVDASSYSIGSQVFTQAKGIVLAVVWSIVVSSAACWLLGLARVLGPLPEAAQEPAAYADEAAGGDAPAGSADAAGRTHRGVWIGIASASALLCLAVGVWALASAGQAGDAAAAQAPAAAASAETPAQMPATAASAAAAASDAQAIATPVPDKRDVSWMMAATLLLMLGLPALGLLGAGLTRSRDAAGVMSRLQIVFSMALLLWLICGYSIAFTEGNAYVGGLDRLLGKGMFDANSGTYANTAAFSKGRYLPEVLYMLFEGCVAGIACCVVVAPLGGVRVRMSGLLVFTVLWLLVVFAPLQHMLLFWLGPDAYTTIGVVDAMNAKAGLAWQWGVLDNGGGLALCLAAATAGTTVFGAAGGRTPRDSMVRPSPWLAVAGAALAWLAWIGFSAGAMLERGPQAALALAGAFVTPLSAALAACAVERLADGKMTPHGAIVGVCAGLAASAVCAGSVSVVGTVVIGLAAGLGSSSFVRATAAMRERTGAGWPMFAALATGAMLGALLIGVFNHPSLGGPGLVVDYVSMKVGATDIAAQLWIQLKGLLLVAGWSGVGTLLLAAGVAATVGLRPR